MVNLELPNSGSIKTVLKDFRDTSYLLVAAIDFGSTYSGYAFSTRFNYKTNPLDIAAFTWSAGSGSMMSLKTATVVLFDPNKRFHSFGFEAENKYAQLADDGKHKDWYLFRRFKMQLYEQKEIKWDMLLSAEDGKTLPALKVFKSCIEFLKDHMLKQCKKQGYDVLRSDIRWVVTVPAIWNEDAKQFMRKAAEMADIPGPQLHLALEAEAASLYCKHLPVDKLTVKTQDTICVFSPTEKYMVLDVGGGTVDITVHEVQNDLTLKEVHMATGGNWGGLVVDDAFENLLMEIVGTDVYKTFKMEHPSDFLELLRNFEVKKRTIKPGENNDKMITYTIPISLLGTYSEMHPEKDISKEIEKNPKLRSNAKWSNDKLRISHNLAKSLFERSLQRIKEHLENLFSKSELEDVSTILMVGGYSDCPLLQAMVEKGFPNKRVIVPNDAGLAILKGAVINGHEPNTITERICRYSYGVATLKPFGIFDLPENMIVIEGEKLCNNIFSSHLEMNQRVPLFVQGESREYSVVTRDQTSMNIEVYRSSDSNPRYCTEDSCTMLGSFNVDMRDISRGRDRGVLVTMTIGGAELQVKAIDRNTKEKQFAYFDFIGKPSLLELEEIVK